MKIDITASLLSSSAYLALRGLEIVCCLIPVVPDVGDKIHLGQVSGLLGRTLATLDGRCNELCVGGPPAGHAADASWLDHLCASRLKQGWRPAVAEILMRLGSRVEQLRRAVESRGPYAVIDQPTALAAAFILNDLLPHLEGCGPRMAIERDDGAALAYTGTETLPPPFGPPARSDDFKLVDKPPTPVSSLLRHADGRAEIIRAIFIDVEISAAEVCAYNIVQFRFMPLSFKMDMARQIWDEVRHADIARERVRQLTGGGGPGGIHTYNVWKKWSSVDSLCEKIAVQQIVQEGNALDASVALAEDYRKFGDEISAQMFEFFIADEAMHTAIGNKWVRYLLNDDDEKYTACIDAAARRIGAYVPGYFPVNVPARKCGGFSNGYTDLLLDRQQKRQRMMSMSRFGGQAQPDAIGGIK